MGEDSSHAERSSVSSSVSSPRHQPDTAKELLIPSFSANSAPSSPAGTLGRLGLRLPVGPTSPVSPGSPVDRGQVSAITVVALLDKLVSMLEAVQDNQCRMEQRQADLEGYVRVVQGDVGRLTRTHATTANSVNKLLERSRKVSGALKEVRERMDKQAAQVKRLEANHHHLLKRNNFKVLIFQEDKEIPSTVFVNDSLKSPQPDHSNADAALPTPSVTGSVDANRRPEGGLHTVSLSSDEEDEDARPRDEESFLESEASLAVGSGGAATLERSRAEKLKRSSLRKVDSLKRAFSRQSIEKKMSKIGTKIVPPERREKIKKSFTPNHPKSPTDRSSSFKVSPMTFNIKKVRDTETPSRDGGGSPGNAVRVEIPDLDGMDGEPPPAEVYSREVLVEDSGAPPPLTPSTPESIEFEPAVNGEERSADGDPSCDRPAGLALPEQDDDENEDEEQEQEDEKERQEVAADVAAEDLIPTGAISVEHNDLIPTGAISVEHNDLIPTGAISVEHNDLIPTGAISVEHNDLIPTGAISVEHNDLIPTGAISVEQAS